jgi:histidine ammonia-lyase
MATHGARRILDMAENAATVTAIELLAAAQGLEFHKPLKTSMTLEKAAEAVRKLVGPYEQDRYFAPDIEAIARFVRTSGLSSFASALLPSWQNQSDLAR